MTQNEQSYYIQFSWTELTTQASPWQQIVVLLLKIRAANTLSGGRYGDAHMLIAKEKMRKQTNIAFQFQENI